MLLLQCLVVSLQHVTHFDQRLVLLSQCRQRPLGSFQSSNTTATTTQYKRQGPGYQTTAVVCLWKHDNLFSDPREPNVTQGSPTNFGLFDGL